MWQVWQLITKALPLCGTHDDIVGWATQASALRAREDALRGFYRKHAPENQSKAREILGKHQGREGELFEKISAKYGEELLDPVRS